VKKLRRQPLFRSMTRLYLQASLYLIDREAAEWLLNGRVTPVTHPDR
jgi:hypothetical protein